MAAKLTKATKTIVMLFIVSIVPSRAIVTVIVTWMQRDSERDVHDSEA